MQVILMHDVLHVGKRGDIVKVKPGYARNYLVPQRLALEATPGNIKTFESARVKIEAQHAQEREAALEVASRLMGLTVTLAKRVTEADTLYGSVTAAEVVEALNHKGVTVDRPQIDLEGGIKTIGQHPVKIELHSEVIAEVTVEVVAAE